MIITKEHLKRLDKASPLFDAADVDLTSKKVDTPFTAIYNVTTGASAIKFFGPVGAPFKMEILDVILEPRDASTNGTITLSNVANAITDVMVCAVDKTRFHALTINDAYSTIDKGGELRIVCAGDTPADTVALITIVAREVE